MTVLHMQYGRGSGYDYSTGVPTAPLYNRGQDAGFSTGAGASGYGSQVLDYTHCNIWILHLRDITMHSKPCCLSQ
jgi:hypothetical protein